MRLFGFDLTLTRVAPATPVWGGRGSWFPIVREPFAGAWQRNMEWTTDSVLAHHAVYACISRIAQDIGKLRPKLVQQDASGIWREVTNTAHSPVLRRPNRFQNHIQFKEWWATSKLLHGNAYVLLERDARGAVRAMYLLDPTRVRVLVAPDGGVFYELSTDNLAGVEQDTVAIPGREIIHDRINCLFHPLVGTSPIFACGTAANMGVQIQENSSAFFGNGSNPSGILSAAVPITPEKSAQLSELWNSRFGRDKSGGVAVLGDGMKFEPMRMSATDSQLIEQLKWTAETVCSTFHVPSFKIGVGAQPTYQNGEILNQIYYSDCLQAPIEQMELCLDQAFGFETPTEGRQLGVELDLDGLLRMDGATQIDTLVKGVRGGVLTPNGARRKLDEPPLEGGDTIYLQHQDYPMEKVFNRNDLDAKAESAAAPPPDDEPTDEDRAARLRLRSRWRARSLRMRTMAA